MEISSHCPILSAGQDDVSNELGLNENLIEWCIKSPKDVPLQ